MCVHAPTLACSAEVCPAEWCTSCGVRPPAANRFMLGGMLAGGAACCLLPHKSPRFRSGMVVRPGRKSLTVPGPLPPPTPGRCLHGHGPGPPQKPARRWWRLGRACCRTLPCPEGPRLAAGCADAGRGQLGAAQHRPLGLNTSLR